MKTLLVYGAGGYGQEIAWLVDDINASSGQQWQLAGYIDDAPERKGQILRSQPVLGRIDEALSTLTDGEVYIAIGIGSPAARQLAAERISRERRCRAATLIHPSVVVGRDVVFEEGSIVGAYSVIGPGAVVRAHTAMNVASGLGHDAEIGAYSMISPGARVSGGCRLGRAVLVGSNAVIAPNVAVGDQAVVGALAFVVRNVEAKHTAFGNPARTYRSAQ